MRTQALWTGATVLAAAGWLGLLPGRLPAAESRPSPGPALVGRLTEAYARQVGRTAYLWGWPLVNVHNRVVALRAVPEPGLGAGVVPLAPPNQLCMLTDHVTPDQRMVACPNQDVVYGFGALDLGKEPVVVQVPDFGGRYWVFQLGDQRTDGFAGVGTMYGTRPGFYLVVGPGWKGAKPDGITAVFRCPTRLGYCVPRVFMDGTPADRAAVRPLVNRIAAYPLAKFDGKPKVRDWAKAPRFPLNHRRGGERKWVDPETYFDALPAVLDEVPPLPGEEPLYAEFRAVLAAAAKDPKLKATLIEAAAAAEQEVVGPLFEFRTFGRPLKGNWTTVTNGAAWGTDYRTRAAVARSNMFVNRPNETRYFYLDLDAAGGRLCGANAYTVTFPKGELPPVDGFWSLTVYDEHHFFHPNDRNRYSVGTKDKGLAFGPDGSLTLFVQADDPGPGKAANWLPSPKGVFSLYLRAYGPRAEVVEKTWTPPGVTRVAK